MDACIPVSCNKPYGVASKEHRDAWIKKHGRIPKGKWVLHKCDNNLCRNDKHLYLGTHADNTRDAVVRKRMHKMKWTRCIHGHLFSKTNTYIRKDGRRVCKTCRKLRMRRYNLK